MCLKLQINLYCSYPCFFHLLIFPGELSISAQNVLGYTVFCVEDGPIAVPIVIKQSFIDRSFVSNLRPFFFFEKVA